MTAYETAKQMYEGKGWDLDKDILLFSRNEYVYITPSHLILAQCCPDCWVVQIAVGKGALRLFVELMPISKPKVAFARGLRNDKIKHYNTERLRRLCIHLT